MGVSEQLRALCGELSASIKVLQRISDFYDSCLEKADSNDRTTENAIILSDIIVNYYTCLETAFFRISQFFENSLDASRWYRDVLKKMTLNIPGIRKRVISDKTFSDLDELLRFRHFKRYYFEFNYDWDRLELVRKKFIAVRERVPGELASWMEYLLGLASATGE